MYYDHDSHDDTYVPCAHCGVPSDTVTRHGACPDCDGTVACRYCGTAAELDIDGHCVECSDVPADAVAWLCELYDERADEDLYKLMAAQG
jgi:RecJ-like exonuclease